MYPDPQNQVAKLPLAKYTRTFYCIKCSCVLNRFPYFDSSYLEISGDVKLRLKDADRKLIQLELHCGKVYLQVFELEWRIIIIQHFGT